MQFLANSGENIFSWLIIQIKFIWWRGGGGVKFLYYLPSFTYCCNKYWQPTYWLNITVYWILIDQLFITIFFFLSRLKNHGFQLLHLLRVNFDSKYISCNISKCNFKIFTSRMHTHYYIQLLFESLIDIYFTAVS